MNKNMMPYQVASRIKAEVIKNADEVTLDMDTNILRFWICEGCFLECLFEDNVVGTTGQLYKYYRAKLKDMFPHKCIRVKL